MLRDSLLVHAICSFMIRRICLAGYIGEMKGWLFRLSRLFRRGRWIGWIFATMSFIIPVKRLRETESLLAFHHPQPSYSIHILIVPKRPYPHLLALETADTVFLTDLFQTVQSLIREFHLEQSGYRLIANGGSYQDIPHLHFHLVGDVAGDG